MWLMPRRKRQPNTPSTRCFDANEQPRPTYGTRSGTARDAEYRQSDASPIRQWHAVAQSGMRVPILRKGSANRAGARRNHPTDSPHGNDGGRGGLSRLQTTHPLCLPSARRYAYDWPASGWLAYLGRPADWPHTAPETITRDWRTIQNRIATVEAP